LNLTDRVRVGFSQSSRQLAKHGVSLVAATGVFDDRAVLIIRDDRDYGGEARYQAIGAVGCIASSAPGRRVVVREELIRHRPGLDPKPEDKTDWEGVRRMTDEEAEAAALSNPDAQPLTDEQLARAFRPAQLELVALRRRLGLDQVQFASRFRVDLDTLKASEAGLCVPEDIARVYLRVIDRNAEAVAAALAD
jgi:putative transcriptional regulator